MESRTHLNLSTIEFDRFNIDNLVTPEFLQAVQLKIDEIVLAEKEKEPVAFSDLETARKAFHETPNDPIMKEYLGEKYAEVDAIALPEFIEDYRKLAVFHAFHARATALAILYADKYMSCLSKLDFDEANYAEAVILSAYTQAMQPDYNRDEMFETAVRSFKHLLAKETDEAKKSHYILQITLAQRCLGLMARRRNALEAKISASTESLVSATGIGFFSPPASQVSTTAITNKKEFFDSPRPLGGAPR